MQSDQIWHNYTAKGENCGGEFFWVFGTICLALRQTVSDPQKPQLCQFFNLRLQTFTLSRAFTEHCSALQSVHVKLQITWSYQ